MAVSRYFLGANTPNGFYSLYDELIDRETARSVYILKGGPGCGKSSFMRRIGRRAETAGLDAQYILCSGDPGSLDGLVLPQLGVALADGTAPHVIEPSCPGAVDHYVNLGRHYDGEGLRPHQGDILAAMEENRAAYRRCYRCLKAAGELEEELRELVLTHEIGEKLAKRARGVLSREFRRDGGQRGGVTRRFLSAITCQGRIALWETVTANYPRIYELQDSYGLAHGFLTAMAEGAALRGYDTVACPAPLAPDRLEHLLVPALGLAFVTASGEAACPVRPYRRLRLDAMAAAGEDWQKKRARVRFAQKISAALTDDALQALARAKEAHDRLEAFYNPYVDFDAVYAEADALGDLILSGSTASPG